MSSEPAPIDPRFVAQVAGWKREVMAAIARMVPPEKRHIAIADVEAVFEELLKAGSIKNYFRMKGVKWRDEGSAAAPIGRHTAKDLLVLVALVEDLGNPEFKAEVIRRPDDGGRPVVLLRESEVDADALRAGLQSAAISFEVQGVAPARETRMGVTSVKQGSEASTERLERILEELKKQPRRDIPGVGAAKSFPIIVDRVPKPQE